MSSFSSFTESKDKLASETLHIKRRTQYRPGEINGRFRIIHFFDKETKQQVSYIPSFDISAYGKNKTTAMAMLKDSVHEYFKFIMNLNQNEMHQQLVSLGWKSDKFFKKNYSHLYVDKNGILQNFNVAEEDITTELVEMVA
ncbi:MAG: hypothetical protein IPJ31_13885 [Bacteroidetes bacterium]|nr:hypothetical protein [Bacteroidota bacterium]